MLARGPPNRSSGSIRIFMRRETGGGSVDRSFCLRAERFVGERDAPPYDACGGYLMETMENLASYESITPRTEKTP